ncbi:MAG TPA: cytochrome c biogenesis protein CcdA [Polyangiaceae bacterium]|nr:cytochrome c biogenesis protein CcdA [Polyangiaceae bacterium]
MLRLALSRLALLPLSLVCLLLLEQQAFAAGPDAFTSALAKGPLYAGLAALAGGFLVSLTPCVYPMIAVTVSVFGARSARGRWEGAALSSAFVAGIVAMFVPLGVVAGLSGSMFGSILQSRWVLVGVSLLFVVLATSLFGAFEFALPSGVTNRLAELGGIGYKGAFALGLACGLIASPCTGPVLTGILTYIAQTRSAATGALSMACFALGLGAPFFLVGTFAIQLPKSGRWMVQVKSVLGIVLLVVALYFLSTAFPNLASWARSTPVFYAAAAALVVVGVALGAVHRDFGEMGGGVKARKAIGIVLVSGAAFALVSGASKPANAFSWHSGGLEAARAQALREKKPLLVDFTAAWCGACKQLDRVTFSAPEVRPEMARFVAVKVDATNNDDPAVESTLARFHVLGLPTVLVFDSSGREAVRYTDFVEPSTFLSAVQRVD